MSILTKKIVRRRLDQLEERYCMGRISARDYEEEFRRIREAGRKKKKKKKRI